MSKVCSQIVLKCLYLARFGRPDILWSVNKLARSNTKWTNACDKRLRRLISYIHQTCGYKQHCHVGNTAKQCRMGLFQDSDFAGDLEDSKDGRSAGGGLRTWLRYVCTTLRESTSLRVPPAWALDLGSSWVVCAFSRFGLVDCLMIVPENRVAMAPRDQWESINSTIIHSLLCPNQPLSSATFEQVKSTFVIVGTGASLWNSP